MRASAQVGMLSGTLYLAAAVTTDMHTLAARQQGVGMPTSVEYRRR